MKRQSHNLQFMQRVMILLALLVLFLATGCTTAAKNSPVNTPYPNFMVSASPIASQQAQLYRILLIMSAVVFVIVEGLLLYNILHHVKKREDRDIPPQHYRQYVIEGFYTGLPILLVIVIFLLMMGTINAIAAPVAKSSDITVHVIGHRWWWEFDYPDLNIKTANELHIPVNTTIRVKLDSLDVIHSFYVPQLSGKTDVVPGVTNQMWLMGDTIGQYHGQCSEYCGLNHANMRFTVFVDSQADFDAWVANQQEPPVEPQTDQQQAGHDIIVKGMCAMCHDLGEEGPGNATAPDLTHLMSRTTFAGGIYDLNEENLRRWLEDTQAMKPGNDMDHKFSEKQIDALVSYLRTLK
jgi:cytochrome c oxidase subunit 2